MISEFKDYYSHIFNPTLLEEIEEHGQFYTLASGEKLIDVGQTIRMMPLLINGAIKVMRDDDDGDELLLYFLEIGDTCAMSFSCCLQNKLSSIRAVAETDISFIGIPIEKMNEWMEKHESWRGFVLDSYHNRMIELLETIDSIAFLKMDERLLKYLKNKAIANKDTIIKSTHLEIAHDLHTSRVVVSRLLKKMESKGWIKLNRNSLELLIQV